MNILIIFSEVDYEEPTRSEPWLVAYVNPIVGFVGFCGYTCRGTITVIHHDFITAGLEFIVIIVIG